MFTTINQRLEIFWAEGAIMNVTYYIQRNFLIPRQCNFSIYSNLICSFFCFYSNPTMSKFAVNAIFDSLSC